ncbi:MAG: helix-turn-helix domain-containing protein [Myxococcota bacterium]
MPERLSDDTIADIHRLAGSLNQRELAARAGVSQATISRVLRSRSSDSSSDSSGGPDTDPADDELTDPDDDLEDRPPPSLVEDLERRIAELERSARLAEVARQFGAATSARKLAAKLALDLAAAREREAASRPRPGTDEPDAELVAELSALVPGLPDAAFEALEVAVALRRRRAVEADRDGR